ncbi:MAG: acetyl-CoA C-acetyltransferase [Deltaproteobacteria bacterium]|nr:acetyl-CoA C-acetyltransferase [Deltaproteobacteria bacterium]
MKNNDAVIISAVRTPIGDFGGAFRDLSAVQLAVSVIQDAVRRAGVDGALVDDVIFGCCIQIPDELTLGRLAALKAGLPFTVPGVTVQRNCASGMQSVVYGAQQILLGDASVIVAGGTESMSTVPYFLKSARWGQRLQHGVMRDGIWDSLTDALTGLIMGLTAENLAEKYRISREEQDEIAFRSHHNAEAATREGRFKAEILPVSIPQRKGEPVVVDTDEHFRPGLTMEDLKRLKPAFKNDGTVTAGNSSGINDGAAALVMMSASRARELGCKPMARIISYAAAAVEPEIMGYGPVPATRKALQKAGLALSDIQLIECNEAFAAQYLACEKLLGWNRDIVNVNGSGIALGHPIGCTGARILTTLLYEMQKRDLTVGLATLCVGGGMGMATIVERI